MFKRLILVCGTGLLIGTLVSTAMAGRQGQVPTPPPDEGGPPVCVFLPLVSASGVVGLGHRPPSPQLTPVFQPPRQSSTAVPVTPQPAPVCEIP